MTFFAWRDSLTDEGREHTVQFAADIARKAHQTYMLTKVKSVEEYATEWALEALTPPTARVPREWRHYLWDGNELMSRHNERISPIGNAVLFDVEEWFALYGVNNQFDDIPATDPRAVAWKKWEEGKR